MVKFAPQQWLGAPVAFKPHHERESEVPAASPPPTRDHYDRLALLNAFAGVFCGIAGVAIALFTYIDAKSGQAESDRKVAEALTQMSRLSTAAQRQADSLSGQIAEMKIQSDQLRSQSDALATSARSAQEQIGIQKSQIIAGDRPAVRVEFIQPEVNKIRSIEAVISNIGDRTSIIENFEFNEIIDNASSKYEIYEIGSGIYPHSRTYFVRDSKTSCIKATGIALKPGEKHTMPCNLSARKPIKPKDGEEDDGLFETDYRSFKITYKYRTLHGLSWIYIGCLDFSEAYSTQHFRQYEIYDGPDRGKPINSLCKKQNIPTPGEIRLRF